MIPNNLTDDELVNEATYLLRVTADLGYCQALLGVLRVMTQRFSEQIEHKRTKEGEDND